jgi:hypothetical protein
MLQDANTSSIKVFSRLDKRQAGRSAYRTETCDRGAKD